MHKHDTNISKQFKGLGLKQFKHNECLWFNNDIMILQYVKDCGISAFTQKKLNNFANKLNHWV